MITYITFSWNIEQVGIIYMFCVSIGGGCNQHRTINVNIFKIGENPCLAF